ncbi:MAG TPA: hypothetical protein VEH50_00580 [Methylomirabilota bacterium]|nr:hypothetical protein [Methylomirabilota bacterium]
MAISIAILFVGDVKQALPLRPMSPTHAVEIPASANLSPLPAMPEPADQEQTPPKKADTLQPYSELALVRYVDGEFAKVVTPLPAGRKGFHLKVGEPLDQGALRTAIGSNGSAANPGDKVQITKLTFRAKEIVVDINGGGRKGSSWKNHVQLEVGGAIPTVGTGQDTVASVQNSPGATLYLDFDRPLPDMTPDELKADLSAMLDFSQQRSAAVQWVDTLPPEMKKAIEEKRAIVGMSRDEVIAAMGKPERKVRETQPDGTEREDWIYGAPPAKTVFVTFEGELVVKVEEFPGGMAVSPE